MNDSTPTPEAEKTGLELFVSAAWVHANTFMAERGTVPDVMVLGRYADEELLFIFPSSQDREAFKTACAAEAAAFGADVAMMVGEATWVHSKADAGVETHDEFPIAKVVYRERGQPIRAEVAFIAESGQEGKRTIGPVSGIPGSHSDPFLDVVFGPEVAH